MRMNEIEEKANMIIKDRRKKVNMKVWITLTIIFISIIKLLRLDKIDNSLFNLFIILLLFCFFYVDNTLQNLVSDIFLINDEEYKLSKKIIKDYNRKVNEIKKKEKREKEQKKLKEEDEREELLNKIKIERSLFEAKRKSQSIQELRQYITDNIEKE